MRCLIIDDDASPRRLMEHLVTRAGHQVASVSSGSAGIAAVGVSSFDVAIIDMEMPGRGGPDTITALRAIDPHLRVLVVSGHDDRRHVMAAFEAGADGYIVKDEIGESLTESLQSVRAGHSPLSPRVAAIMLRQLRTELAKPPVVATRVGRLRKD
jgi:DNA-binding NarL/FixJ family response regulator